MPKLKVILKSLIGECLKAYYKIGFATIPYGLNLNESRERKIIASLTSYGRRVSSTVYFTIVSIMKQSKKADRIILWLDNRNWNKNNLPKNLIRLQENGLEIRFYDDIRSYKKLIPTLKEFPNDLIITFDDDIFYESTVIEELHNAYNSDNKSIHAFLTSAIKFDSMNNPDEYWCKEGHPNRFDLATGVGSILYSKDLLYKDICDESLFKALAPLADDIWFYFMEVLQGTHVNMVRKDDNKLCFYPLDSFYQRLHSNSSLNSSNLHQNGNNRQIKAIMEYYNLSIDFLKNFSRMNPNTTSTDE